MSHVLPHTPRVYHPRELSREEQTSTIKRGSPEGSSPNERRSCSPSGGRGRLPSVSAFSGSCSTSASSPTRDCSPTASRGYSHQASTPPRKAARHRRAGGACTRRAPRLGGAAHHQRTARSGLLFVGCCSLLGSRGARLVRVALGGDRSPSVSTTLRG